MVVIPREGPTATLPSIVDGADMANIYALSMRLLACRRSCRNNGVRGRMDGNGKEKKKYNKLHDNPTILRQKTTTKRRENIGARGEIFATVHYYPSLSLGGHKKTDPSALLSRRFLFCCAIQSVAQN